MGAIGTGASVVFGTSGFTAEVMSISGTDVSRPAIKTSHLGTTTWDTKTFGDLTDPGGMDMEILLDPAAHGTDSPPPYTASATETITLCFPGTNATATNNAHMAGSGFVTAWSFGVPLEEVMTASLSCAFTGALAWTAGV